MDSELQSLLGVAADRAEETGHWLAPYLRALASGRHSRPHATITAFPDDVRRVQILRMRASFQLSTSLDLAISDREIVASRDNGQAVYDSAVASMANTLGVDRASLSWRP